MFTSSEAVKRPLKLFAVFYIAAIFFGAPLWSDIQVLSPKKNVNLYLQATSLLAATLTACVGIPLLLVYRNDQQIFDIIFSLK